MDRSNIIYLIAETFTTDDLGQQIPAEEPRAVYCDIDSINGSEWFQARQQGMNPQHRIRMFKYDYQGETIVNIGGTLEGGALTGGKRYGVYRTYERRTDEIELYLELKAGVS